MVKAFLSSLLARQYLVLKDSFAQRYPNPWLVWEPGPWSAPDSSDVSATRLPTVVPDRPAVGDALCFELGGKRAPVLYTVGRSPHHTIVINDATVSRHHLNVRSADGQAWSVDVPAEARSAAVGGVALTPGETRSLKPGDRIQIGQVVLTYMDPVSFVQRLQIEADKIGA